MWMRSTRAPGSLVAEGVDGTQAGRAVGGHTAEEEADRDRDAQGEGDWVRITRRGAPSALRMPISRVRSVTVTSMMLVMPMPPTSRLMPATAPSSVVNVSAVSVCVSSSCDAFWMR
jgi:hypothetical protein